MGLITASGAIAKVTLATIVTWLFPPLRQRAEPQAAGTFPWGVTRIGKVKPIAIVSSRNMTAPPIHRRRRGETELAMPYICKKPEDYKGLVVGNGQCVRFPQKCAGAPVTSSWKQGVKVKGNVVAKGTAIGTFVDGKYPNAAHGNHAAIYIEQDAAGIWVWDQWTGQAVHKRLIRFKTDKASPSNNGNAFSVIE